MIKYKLEYIPYGSSAILVKWPQSINKNILKDIQGYQTSIENNLNELVVDFIPTYASLTIVYKSINFNELCAKLKAIYEGGFEEIEIENTLWQLPVCYDQTLGFDLESYCQEVGLSIKQVIQIHTETIYTIYFTGFLPGFLYLGSLDERLFLKRKAKPLLKVPGGAVGIGGQQTGIYPQESPGGWHIIGNCPVSLFNVERNPPSIFKHGDKIQFYSISLKDYQQNSFQVIKKIPNA